MTGGMAAMLANAVWSHEGLNPGAFKIKNRRTPRHQCRRRARAHASTHTHQAQAGCAEVAGSRFFFQRRCRQHPRFDDRPSNQRVPRPFIAAKTRRRHASDSPPLK